jgi:hypothetical protein
MKKTLAIALLFVVASCAGSSSGKTTAPVSADRDKFVGTWAGSYGCFAGASTADTLVIRLGAGALDFSITIHSGFGNPDTVTGELTGPNQISVPEQSMGGAPGTAKITSKGDLLEFSQTGLGVTCGGKDYARVP